MTRISAPIRGLLVCVEAFTLPITASTAPDVSLLDTQDHELDAAPFARAAQLATK
jgi:hypothetical protein